MTKTLGQIAYEAYAASTGWKSAVSGAPLPQWSDQAPAVSAAWEASASAIAAEVVPQSQALLANFKANVLDQLRRTPVVPPNGDEGYLSLWLQELVDVYLGTVRLNSDLRNTVAEERTKAEKGQAFKDFVHNRLDQVRVPAEIQDHHLAEGCRIGGRLDWLIERAHVGTVDSNRHAVEHIEIFKRAMHDRGFCALVVGLATGRGASRQFLTYTAGDLRGLGGAIAEVVEVEEGNR